MSISINESFLIPKKTTPSDSTLEETNLELVEKLSALGEQLKSYQQQHEESLFEIEKIRKSIKECTDSANFWTNSLIVSGCVISAAFIFKWVIKFKK